MLHEISSIPHDKPVAGVHVVPVCDDRSIVMGWHMERGLLETVGGRIEQGETVEDALRREALEEAGLILAEPFIPFASFYWESTDTYTIWFVARVQSLTRMPSVFETSGRVVTNVRTAQAIIRRVEADGEWRIQLLAWAARAMERLPM